MLPIAPFTETSGTFVNIEGRIQSFNGVVKPRGDARPAWKVLRVLGNVLNLEGFDYIEQSRCGTKCSVPGANSPLASTTA
jgi:NADH dehydrogenase/NADH:ubiquinone oxidoreductase subunit G